MKTWRLWVSVGVLVGLLGISVGVSWFWDTQSFDPALAGMAQGPSWDHWFGTDDTGRDYLLRCLAGARQSLAVGFVAVGIATSLGLSVGLLAGFGSQRLDEWVMRGLDFLMSLPTFFLILSIQVMVKPSIWTVMTVIGLTSWMGTARMVRAQVKSVKASVFVTALYARGLPRWRILFKHVLPHCLTPVWVSAMMGMGHAIMTESVLSFLGLGVQPPAPSWGNMLENSLSYLYEAPWLAVFPGLLMMMSVMAVATIGDVGQERMMAEHA